LDGRVDLLLPPSSQPPAVTEDADLADLYAFPTDPDRPWVKVNFVTSTDGAVAVGGRSKALSDPHDQRVFRLGRGLADVVLVGAGTVIAEHYRGVRPDEMPTDLRAKLGLAPVPPVAVVTASCSIPPGSPVFTDVRVPTIVFTCAGAPADHRAALTDAGADVVVTGTDEVDIAAVLAELDRRGLRRVACEGGPTLFGSLITADVVDELDLSIAPLLTAGSAGRIAHDPAPSVPREMRLASVLRAGDLLLLRYIRDR
jgi:5-amino-6-(5-phosphoribosylamino)uracil reductase